MTGGRVTLVGAGPGDPALITLAGVAALAEADVVVYDALAPAALLRHARPEAELIHAGKRASAHALDQDAINALLVERAAQGKVVCRLKGGDPFVFGRGGEEALACRAAGIPFRVVPGITSAIAAAAYAGIPVTHRGLSSGFLVLTASEPGAVDWAAAARADTLVLLMGAGTLADAMARLAAAGKPAATPVACIRWGTRPDQEVVCGTVAGIAERVAAARLEAPVATIVGEVAGLAGQLAWFDPGPLAGRRVVVTRARAQASELVAGLAALGAQVVEAPVLRTAIVRGNEVLAGALRRQPAWIAFTSANAVAAVAAVLAENGSDARALAGSRLAAAGEATTAVLRAHGLRADWQPSRALAARLAGELPVAPGETVLWPTSPLAEPGFAEALASRGASVERVTAYDTLPVPLDEQARREIGEADAVTFSSASTARFLRGALGEQPLPASAMLVSIGPQTSSAVRECFGRVDREAATPAVAALIAATCDALGVTRPAPE